MNTEKKTAVITGATGGIGSEVALRFASEGYKVAIVDLPASDAKALLSEIKSMGGEATFIGTDVTSSANVTSMVCNRSAPQRNRHSLVPVHLCESRIRECFLRVIADGG